MNSLSKYSPESPENKVFSFFRNYPLFREQKSLVVAVSGGADSICLLKILANLKNELGINLHVAHLNHQLRGRESDDDAMYVSLLAYSLGLPCTIEERDVKSYQAEYRCTLEEAAREVRYAFLAETARKLGTDLVATGHTRNDNIETILLHLVRGTGTRGLCGLRPVTPLETESGTIRVARPLLGISREETEKYCAGNGLEPKQDSSNFSLSPLRNRIRQQLLPLLESYNQRFGDALLRTASAASDELDFLDSTVAGLEAGLVEKEGNTVILDKEFFLSLPPALKRHLLRQVLEDIYGNLKDIETRHIEDIIDISEKQAGKMIHLPDGIIVTVEYDRLLLNREPAELSHLPPLDGEYSLTIPGETVLSGWKVTAEISGRENLTASGDSYIMYFDFDKTGSCLTVRPRRPSDRFQPLGTDYSKKLGEFIIDAKIPRAWRDRVPVVCSPEQIIWLVGWRIDDRVKLTDRTDRLLKLEFRC